MQNFLTVLLNCSISMSLIILVFIAITPILKKKYAAKWRYYAWLVIVIGLIFPFRPHIDTAFIQIDVPVPQTTVLQNNEIEYIVQDNTKTSSYESVDSTMGTQNSTAISWYQLAILIWVLGAFGVITYHTIRHRRFISMVNRWSEDITNRQVTGTLQKLKKEMGISDQVDVKVCSCITSSMLIGFFKHVILLPATQITSNDLTLILRHELVHLKRKDLWFKLLVLVSIGLHWFNPVVYIMAMVISRQCEISCDEAVLEGASFRQRKQYGETIINASRSEAKLKTVLSTNFYGGKRSMKNRIISIMDSKKKKSGIAIVCMSIFATIGIGMTLGITGCNSTTAYSGNNRNIIYETSQTTLGQTHSEQNTNQDKIVLIDPGHGGKDTGAIYTDNDGINIVEKDLNLKISLLLKEILEQSGFQVKLTRDEDREVSLKDRMQSAIDLNAFMLVSIHSEASHDDSMKGISIEYNSSDDDSSYGITGQKAAQLIYKAMAEEFGEQNGMIAAMSKSLKYDALKMPVVYISPAYITNEFDRKMLTSEKFCNKAAEALHDGIIAVLNGI